MASSGEHSDEHSVEITRLLEKWREGDRQAYGTNPRATTTRGGGNPEATVRDQDGEILSIHLSR